MLKGALLGVLGLSVLVIVAAFIRMFKVKSFNESKDRSCMSHSSLNSTQNYLANTNRHRRLCEYNHLVRSRSANWSLLCFGSSDQTPPSKAFPRTLLNRRTQLK